MSKCICENPNKSLHNIHSQNKPIDMILLGDKDGYGIVVFESHEAIAVFDIDYCPKCGRKLTKEQ
ncbi:hypothetical protein ACR77J_07580 [Tissierella praeacuta]|uniref:hypothetical protein n=1 Tax=Tissierella praeacuta TaxID=43131 RepID=UPI003DA35A06